MSSKTEAMIRFRAYNNIKRITSCYSPSIEDIVDSANATVNDVYDTNCNMVINHLLYEIVNSGLPDSRIIEILAYLRSGQRHIISDLLVGGVPWNSSSYEEVIKTYKESSD
ncbi:unnamed protein product [Phytophthora lilii]|uniref:Unnamed protein product n=1 Tax=Phytophthora lilii TaxID=2077276 RepID=A0A9W6X436_9STRA|nr:unnamed protein product [Phytophthora lilii]